MILNNQLVEVLNELFFLFLILVFEIIHYVVNVDGLIDICF